jgi:hypothetical protein
MATPQYSFLDNPDIIEILGMEKMDKTVGRVVKILVTSDGYNTQDNFILANLSIVDFTYVRQISEIVPFHKTCLYYGHLLYHYMNMSVDIFLEIFDHIIIDDTLSHYMDSPTCILLGNKNIPADILYAGIEKYGSKFLDGNAIECFIDFTKQESFIEYLPCVCELTISMAHQLCKINHDNVENIIKYYNNYFLNNGDDMGIVKGFDQTVNAKWYYDYWDRDVIVLIHKVDNDGDVPKYKYIIDWEKILVKYTLDDILRLFDIFWTKCFSEFNYSPTNWEKCGTTKGCRVGPISGIDCEFTSYIFDLNRIIINHPDLSIETILWLRDFFAGYDIDSYSKIFHIYNLELIKSYMSVVPKNYISTCLIMGMYTLLIKGTVEDIRELDNYAQNVMMIDDLFLKFNNCRGSILVSDTTSDYRHLSLEYLEKLTLACYGEYQFLAVESDNYIYNVIVTWNKPKKGYNSIKIGDCYIILDQYDVSPDPCIIINKLSHIVSKLSIKKKSARKI